MKITFLGTGTSMGVPRIDCDCAVCRSTDSRNKRLRCSLLIERRDWSVLIDTTPDLRTQALQYNIRRLDAVLFTHAHADHLHGLDDVRCFCFARQAPLPCYADRRTIERIATVFDYAFRTDNPSSVPQLSLHPIDGPFDLLGLSIVPVPVYHGRLTVLGFRLGDFAYLTDCSAIPAASMAQLCDLDTLVLDGMRHRQHPTHFNLEQALRAVDQIQPRRALFTHIAHDLDHQTTNDQLPAHAALAYDGLVLNFD